MIHFIKYFTKVAIVVIALGISVAANAQQAGYKAWGGNLLVGTGGDFVDFGLGGVFLYNATDLIRLSGEIDLLWGYNTKSNSLIRVTSQWREFSVYGHYLVPAAKRNGLYVYPLVGIGIVNIGMKSTLKSSGVAVSASESKPVFTFGLGRTGAISDWLVANYELRLKMVEGKFRYQAAVGVVYKF